MQISERQRKYGQGKTYIKTKKKLPVNFDIASLDLMCQYTLTENRNIKRGAYINLRNLIEILDMEKYNVDQEKFKRITFIRRSLEARLEKGLKNTKAIVKFANGGLVDDDLVNVEEYDELSNQEIDWINETVSNTLNLTFLYEEADRAIDLWTKFKVADSSNISALGKKLEEHISYLNTRFRQAKVQSVINQTFSLKGDSLNNIIETVHEELSNEYRKLVTGMQGFNMLLGGGFENTRCYLFIGSTGVGKSLTMLDIAYQIKKYNKNFKPKDPTKIPCVVYLTMENTVTETVDRLFKMATGDDIRNVTPEQAVEMLKKNGELYLTDDSPIDIIIKYQPNRSVDTGYLYTLTEDLEDEGYEVIALIQDHVKRIRSVSNQQDVRLELGEVINEFKTFAILKDIPVITVSHINRDGAKILDSAPTRTKSDLTRLLGKSNIGESLLMLDNVDFSAILNVDYDDEGMKWLIAKTIKQRFGTLRNFICHPYLQQNEIKLIEDFYAAVPIFKDTLHENSLNRGGVHQTVGDSCVRKSEYSSIPVYDDGSEENVYNTMYSSVNINGLSSNNIPSLSIQQQIIYKPAFGYTA